jgi:7-keto-8-aminopelargonate synthetase-like enzyme
MRKDITQIGMTYQVMSSQGIEKLEEIAREYDEQQQYLLNQQEWTYDRYLKNSSYHHAEVCTPFQKSNLCSVWSVNHYLGLNRHPYVIQKAKDALEVYGTGSGTSAMSGGQCELHKALRERFADLFAKEDALLFPTGFTANSGVIPTLCRSRETLILIDRNCHASIVEGCRTAASDFLPFKHNSAKNLEEKLIKYSKKYTNILVVVESAYSMEGDIAPLQEIVMLKQKHKFLLYVDEAHTFGFYGKNGVGLCDELGVTGQVDFLMTTLSKSTASIGGVVAMSRAFATFLRCASNAYIFQAAIPPVDVAVVHACLDLMENDPSIARTLWEKTHDLRQKLISAGFDVGKSQSPIVPVYIRDSKILKEIGRELLENGIFTTAIEFPAVKASEVRFRFIVNRLHTQEEIDHLVCVLKQLGIRHGLIRKT